MTVVAILQLAPSCCGSKEGQEKKKKKQECERYNPNGSCCKTSVSAVDDWPRLLAGSSHCLTFSVFLVFLLLLSLGTAALPVVTFQSNRLGSANGSSRWETARVTHRRPCLPEQIPLQQHRQQQRQQQMLPGRIPEIRLQAGQLPRRPKLLLIHMPNFDLRRRI